MIKKMYVLIVHVLFIALFGLAFEKTVLYFCESKRERKKRSDDDFLLTR